MSLFLSVGYSSGRVFKLTTLIMERKKEENMEKFINNAPFALVLVCLIIGFVLLIKGADFS